MKYTVKVSIFGWIKKENTCECGEPKTVINFEFSDKEDMYETLIPYAKDFTAAFTYLDEWFCISTDDESGVTIIEFKDYQDYIDDIKLPIRELPQPEDIFDERTSK
jgi:hypothetical protein